MRPLLKAVCFFSQGKLLNVREASFKQLKENKEIQNVLKILGLQINDNRQDAKGLRYGSLMIMTDQVGDGLSPRSSLSACAKTPERRRFALLVCLRTTTAPT